MSIENPSSEIYDAQGLEGPARDFEHIFNSPDRKEALIESKEANDLYEMVVSTIDKENFPAEGGNVEEIIRAIRIAAKEGGWKSYDDVKFDSIRAELRSSGIPMRPRLGPRDF